MYTNGFRQYDHTLAQLSKALELNPHYHLAHWVLGHCHAYRLRCDEAEPALRRAVDLSGRNPFMLASLGWLLGLRGREAEAREVLAELQERSSHQYVSPWLLGGVLFGLGELDRAMACFEKAYEERYPWMITLRTDPAWDPLRDDPRMVALMEKVYGSTT
jgi:tetratricopeptide (TPR) repeat protein